MQSYLIYYLKLMNRQLCEEQGKASWTERKEDVKTYLKRNKLGFFKEEKEDKGDMRKPTHIGP